MEIVDPGFADDNDLKTADTTPAAHTKGVIHPLSQSRSPLERRARLRTLTDPDLQSGLNGCADMAPDASDALQIDINLIAASPDFKSSRRLPRSASHEPLRSPADSAKRDQK